MPLMSNHVAAVLQALAAFFSTAGHMLIAFELLALGGALVASLCTGFADNVAERPMPGDNASRGRAGIGAVLAGLQRRHVLLLAVDQHVGTVEGTRVAFPLAVVASVGALAKNSIVSSVFVVLSFSIIFILGKRRIDRQCGCRRKT